MYFLCRLSSDTRSELLASYLKKLQDSYPVVVGRNAVLRQESWQGFHSVKI